MPTGEEIARAERIVRAFDENPGAGTLGLDGEMIDRPHLLQARRIAGLAETLRVKHKQGSIK